MKKKMIGGIAALFFCAAIVSAGTGNAANTSIAQHYIYSDTMPKSDTGMGKHRGMKRKMNDSSHRWSDSSMHKMKGDSSSVNK